MPKRHRLVVGSKNPNKAEEIRSILSDLTITVRSLEDFGEIEDVEETGITFEENAVLKARAFAKATGQLTIGDDSGLCVDALDGAPGIYSARYAGPRCSHDDNNRKLLDALKDVPLADRTAYFNCTIACATPDELLFVVEGRVHGVITDAPRGTKGFGFDPVFRFEPLDKTFGELDPEQKNGISHRGAALRQFREKLAEWLASQA